ncbi:cytochrome D ubiquinol oxidase subunit I [Salipiger aestuarii]|uniref:Cytochrome d ubiquinol oxidase subunit I n=1 Tax=Salipiger aestuarii TaxID=568098 RepID=A0A327Y8X1_9RHOB|nr:cytochrome ubiquinol oxidase subunit I [Salipiger aestuarii]EIE50924.1 putative quinol oxidase subunit I transmembrane protein [Citreicella sp. 357]KAA8607399.1 cytochrome D ubiquinol oxidase subunit I [Salipiger aestuarii]KAA8612115.1 cytochrome D ubiquinol oxidase subunit I [Salipiger aestuarii]KAB2541748.1 cytochrome D ubiquinol oxidase subunit I [Salipiger aestuarii]RAK17254.1 cytochrome d ubiquinol oxidase subunit I [Salipiger aestuarii]
MDTFLGLDATLLARIQFGFTVSFHFIFPSISIGLASYLAVLNGLYLWRGDEVYLRLFNYWLKIFAIAFGMGVVSGIVMSYQFGTNWSGFSDLAGPVVGPLMAYEVLTAFFLEAGFLGIMLFGRRRVGPGLHFFATLMVAVGTAISATWILSVNSWMQTPQGFAMNADGQFVPEDWWQIVFTPSFPYRLAHTLTASYLATAFIVGGVAAWHLLRGEAHNAVVRKMASMALWMIVITAPLQVVLGHEHGLNTYEHQPVKISAMEGHFESHEDGAPLILFGIPDQEAGEMRYDISVPHLSSVIFGLGWNGAMDGLDVVPDTEEPPVAVVFWSFRVMVGIGFLMVGIGLWGLWARFRGNVYASPMLWRAMIAMGPSGLVAVIAGWITTEVGRQPYVVYGQLRTADAVSPLGASAVGWSLIAFIVIYFAVFGAGVAYILRLMHRAPSPVERGPRSSSGPTRSAGVTPQAQIDAKGHPGPAE